MIIKEAEKLLAKLRAQRETQADQSSPGEPVTASPRHAAAPEFTPEKVAQKPREATLAADEDDSEKIPIDDPYLAAAESETEYFNNPDDYHFALWVKGLGQDWDGSITPTEPESDGEIVYPDKNKQSRPGSCRAL